MADLPTDSPGADGSDPVMDSQSMNGGSLVAVSSESEETSASGGNMIATIFLFTSWIVLLTLMVAVIYLVAADKRRIKRKEQLQQQQEQVGGVLETVVQTSTQFNWVGIATILLGSCIGLALSIFSLVTCKFLDLDSDIKMDAYLEGKNLDRESITIHSLGLWAVDMTSGSGISGCFNADSLPFLDWIFKLARASSVIANVMGAACLVILMMCAMKPEFRERIHHLVWPFLLATIFQLLTLTLFNSVYCDFEWGKSCRANFGAITSTTATFYWAFGAFAAALLPFQQENPRQLR